MQICIRKIYKILASQIRLLTLVLTDQLKLLLKLMKLGGFFTYQILFRIPFPIHSGITHVA